MRILKCQVLLQPEREKGVVGEEWCVLSGGLVNENMPV